MLNIAGRLNLNKFRVKLDWKAYFQRFCAEHGDPVFCRGRLLFPDGWQYSSTDYAGPEWEPPKDEKELRELQRAYWTIRRAMVMAELTPLQNQYKMLQDLQRLKSAPLQRVFTAWDENDEKPMLRREDYDDKPLQGRIDWLRNDLRECEDHLKELRS